MPNKSNHLYKKPNHFRIIGGKWRRRSLSIPNHAAVRPTPNRIRETLFNWLMHEIQGAICLDAFAGSGALGLEALSRGAQHVYFIETESSVVQMLQQHLQILNCTTATLMHAATPNVLATFKQVFDIVFIDPPFQQGLVLPTLRELLNYSMLNSGALVYVEAEVNLPLITLINQDWRLLKSTETGQVACYLLQQTSVN